MTARKPGWLRVNVPGGARYQQVRDTVKGLALHTVCEEAHCPNVAECWGGGTATVMLMGDVCTRGCRFCNVKTDAHPPPLDPDEPRHLAEAIAELGLDYIVVTSVDRDDLPDGGAGHFADAIRRLKDIPQLLVEVLTPDFRGDAEAVRTVGRARPDVFANNLETVRRLTPVVRDLKAGYDQTLAVLARMKREFPRIVTKSSIMVGLGETEDELLEAMGDLRAAGVEILTLGQYLRPSAWHLPVVEYVKPEKFAAWREAGLGLGFRYVASGPLVRSSYRAAELFLRGELASRPPGP
ncbi:lipoyl synthase [Anaeromyxobacter sp. Fw109-5]|uniref:Lipoyl synthase n=1 Tax=Anaeromyxobacter sp. (strain Fw109-5) TaxID=404589 RepID=LIPA_ANADF|nr:lipoyl synthase [Anaeromyxobacter sp. Fw109-5]A7HBU9.1 RecName: Full=Lipoyl synthase; AltName: Full=Lip-syn; Short=LS; AltName: Full=Lipoate synthase; AltName: Full=Lipoic acid synthase; AltName: Full=Sulfur insertion protein LipA [Anaeromyxobacter sp. Fw109-5]ABS26195.1 lipoic acid synthetase [Anaeromyxobacter sp. Fw109-5]